MGLFGSAVVDYCIVVITHEDDLIYHNMTKEQYLGDSNSQLRCFVNKCGDRCIVVNSITKNDNERKEKLIELLQCIDNISENKQTPYYTHQLFKQAAQDEAKRRLKDEQDLRNDLGEAEIRNQVTFHVKSF